MGEVRQRQAHRNPQDRDPRPAQKTLDTCAGTEREATWHPSDVEPADGTVHLWAARRAPGE